MQKRSGMHVWGIAAGVLAALALEAGETVRYTAEYYRAFAYKYNGKRVHVYVSHLRPTSGARLPIELAPPKKKERRRGEDTVTEYQIFNAATAYRGQTGGDMEVVIPQQECDKYLRRVGTRPEKVRGKIVSHRLAGILVVDPRRRIFLLVEAQKDPKWAENVFRQLQKFYRESARSRVRIDKDRLVIGEESAPVAEVLQVLRAHGLLKKKK